MRDILCGRALAGAAAVMRARRKHRTPLKPGGRRRPKNGKSAPDLLGLTTANSRSVAASHVQLAAERAGGADRALDASRDAPLVGLVDIRQGLGSISRWPARR
jgi:hypothetical protein